ncbi:MAG TPA: hypothetical protein VEA80_12415 [Vitreimonas sp.]|uniref:hypothetical protein n=1 Tax=Vitreimonas sp. TaxID=3069702 RepID=UPI002D50F155|nr:hypothetical protein [Vitreimonas sp.]HYD88275.1 hypothetical protein [Vitreimonas sp.]
MRPPPPHLTAIVVAVLIAAAAYAAATAFLYAFFVTGLHSSWRGWAINIGLLWPFFVIGLWLFRAQPALDKQVRNEATQVHPLVWAWRVVVGADQR